MQEEIFSEPYSLDKAKRYEVIRTVGRGAFGEVLLAWDTQHQPANPNGFAGSEDGGGRSHGDDDVDMTVTSSNDRRFSALGQSSSACGQSSSHLRRRGRAVSSREENDHHRGFVALKSVACVGGGWWRGGSGRSLSKGLFRELRALQMLDCAYVVRLLDVYPEPSSVVLVLEYMPSDLGKVLDYSTSPLSEPHCKAFAAMLLKGLAFVHSHGLLHRDIKPSNLLISAGGVLKIADFGQARTHTVPQTRSYSHQVATRWYRAPELLYGTRRYGFAVDLWAAGAIVGEMIAGRPLFQGRSDIDQLQKILQVTGTPTEVSWPGVSDLPDYDKVHFADMAPQDPGVVFQGASTEACGLAMGLLRLDPRGRTSAENALRHSFFFVAPEPTPCHLLPRTSADGHTGVGAERPRGPEFLDEGWWLDGF